MYGISLLLMPSFCLAFRRIWDKDHYFRSAFVVNHRFQEEYHHPSRRKNKQACVAFHQQITVNLGRKASNIYDFDRQNEIEMSQDPEESESRFGRMEYWNKTYANEEDFSWYASWNDIEPFFVELVPLSIKEKQNVMNEDNDGNKVEVWRKPHVLIPGIGNDRSMVDMYDYGYTNMTAFDYAPEGIECAKRLFGKDRQRSSLSTATTASFEDAVDLLVADGRNLPFKSNVFDAVLEKGTLDAIYLSGGKNKTLASNNLSLAESELARVVRKGGIVMSITAACAQAVEEVFARSVDINDGISTNEKTGVSTEQKKRWRVLRDGSLYMTEDGYASNNVDGTIFAWERL